MKTKIFIIISCLTVLYSCAKLPMQSIELTDAISKEGERMHDLNISLVNNMFVQKEKQADDYIKDVYTPAYMSNFKKRIPDSTDYEKEWPNILQAILPAITSRKDTVHNALESQRLKLINKLDSDYKVFDDAVTSLRNLISSAVKVDELRRQAVSKLNVLAGNKINIDEIGNKLDDFILKASDITNTTQNKVDDLNSTINSLLNQ
jgi:hypothetical protein